MTKRYTNHELKNQLTHIILVSFDVIQNSAKELRELELSEEEWKSEEQSERLTKGKQLVARMNLFNYLLQPSYGLARQLFPLSKNFIDVCEKNYNEGVKNKTFPESCSCVGCAKE